MGPDYSVEKELIKVINKRGLDGFAACIRTHNVSLNSPYFHEDGPTPAGLYKLPGVMRIFGEGGFDFDTDRSIKRISDNCVDFLNDRGLDNIAIIVEELKF